MAPVLLLPLGFLLLLLLLLLLLVLLLLLLPLLLPGWLGRLPSSGTAGAIVARRSAAAFACASGQQHWLYAAATAGPAHAPPPAWPHAKQC
jgi:hypothetical protein